MDQTSHSLNRFVFTLVENDTRVIIRKSSFDEAQKNLIRTSVTEDELAEVAFGDLLDELDAWKLLSKLCQLHHEVVLNDSYCLIEYSCSGLKNFRYLIDGLSRFFKRIYVVWNMDKLGFDSRNLGLLDAFDAFDYPKALFSLDKNKQILAAKLGFAFISTMPNSSNETLSSAETATVVANSELEDWPKPVLKVTRDLGVGEILASEDLVIGLSVSGYGLGPRLKETLVGVRLRYSLKAGQNIAFGHLE